MAKVILVGADVALLEGLAQTLLGFGHDVSFATTVGEMAGMPLTGRPAIAVVSADSLFSAGLGATVPLSWGGALIVYGTSHENRPVLPTRLQRATVAYLVLPLERHRLMALVQSFDSRSRVTGRDLPERVGDESDPPTLDFT